MANKTSRKDTRRFVRREIRMTAIVLTPDGLRLPCEIGDVSETGALVLLDTPHPLPHEFMLEITGNESIRRRCHLTRQEGATAGVRFPDRPLTP